MTNMTKIPAYEFIAPPEMELVSNIPAMPASVIAKGVVRYGFVVVGMGVGPTKVIGIYERKDGTAYARVQYEYGGRYSTQVDVIEADDYMTAFLLAAS